MTQIVLFHSGLGLRTQVTSWQKRLEALGHRVLTPDLYDGEVFDDLDAGVAKRDALGIPELQRRTAAAVEGLPPDLIYAGFSMGAASAQALALTRPGARGVVLMHAALPLEMLGVSSWPENLPGQIHFAEADPWVDSTVVDAIAHEQVSVFKYPGSGHLFADDGLDEYDEASAELMFERLVEFVKRHS